MSMEIGARCRDYRVRVGKLQSDVAAGTGYGVPNISAFENGRNCNYRILLWYLRDGMTVRELLGEQNG